MPEIETLLEEAELKTVKPLIVAREISRNGRSVGRVNGGNAHLF